MVTVPITLPEDVFLFVETQVAARGLAGPGEYLCALIAGARKEQEQADLEVRFAEAVRAIERGEGNPLSAEDWQLLQQRVLSRPRPTTGKPRP